MSVCSRPAACRWSVGRGTEPKLPVTFSCGYSNAQSGALERKRLTACTALGPSRTGNGDGTTRTSYVQVGGTIGSTDTTDRIPPDTYTASLVFTVTAVY